VTRRLGVRQVASRLHHFAPRGCYKSGMDDQRLVREIRSLRAQGRSPKAIARALGVSPAQVAAHVRTIAREQAAAAPERGVIGCWVSPGWSAGLSVPADRHWPDRPSWHAHRVGLVGVLVARARQGQHGNLSACGYLVDPYCLGVKNALGPRTMGRSGLRRFVDQFFAAFDAAPIEAPLDLARHMVFGAVEYARGLGFEPHADFRPAADHLGPRLDGPSAIGFGCDGVPSYTQGPFDDADRVLRTLRAHVGDDFHFTVEVSPEELVRIP